MKYGFWSPEELDGELSPYAPRRRVADELLGYGGLLPAYGGGIAGGRERPDDVYRDLSPALSGTDAAAPSPEQRQKALTGINASVRYGGHFEDAGYDDPAKAAEKLDPAEFEGSKTKSNKELIDEAIRQRAADAYHYGGPGRPNASHAERQARARRKADEKREWMGQEAEFEDDYAEYGR